MTVRAKFKVTSIERTMGSMPSERDANGRATTYAPAEMWTIKASPVYANNDPEHENSKFWSATPTGSLVLGVVNAEAVRQFDIDREYYVDFTPADSAS